MKKILNSQVYRFRQTQVLVELLRLKQNISNLRYANDTMLIAEIEEELKSLLMNVKEESEKLV